MKVTNCRNCPFRTPISNDWLLGYDSADICSLEVNKNLLGGKPEQGLIRSYNEYDDLVENGQPEKEIPSPDWCTLKIVGNLTIDFEF